MAQKKNYSFLKGCGKVAAKDTLDLRKELVKVLGCKSVNHFYKKRKSYPNMPAHVKEEIETVFEKYGITNPDDIWDITEATS